MFRLYKTAAVALLSSAVATEVMAKSSFGGIIFTDWYVIDRDSENNSGGVAQGDLPDADSFTGSQLELPNISRLRASWSNEDDLRMYIELGIGGANGSSGVNTRQAYGTYKINDRWQILAGHSSSPVSPLFPSQLIGNSAPESASNTPTGVGGSHNTGKGYGDFDGGRNPQLRLTYTLPNRHGALAVAILNSNQGRGLDLPGEFPTKPAREGLLPRLDIGGAFNLRQIRIFPGVSIQEQQYNGVLKDNDDSVTTWAASLGLQTATGPFELSAEYNYGHNWKNASYSLANSAAAISSSAKVAINNAGNIEIQDRESQSYWIDLGWRFTTKNTSSVLHFVYGAMETEDADAVGPTQGDSRKSTMAGVSLPIETPWIARGLTIRPEVFVYDEGVGTLDGKTIEYGKATIAGIQLQFTF